MSRKARREAIGRTEWNRGAGLFFSAWYGKKRQDYWQVNLGSGRVGDAVIIKCHAAAQLELIRWQHMRVGLGEAG